MSSPLMQCIPTCRKLSLGTLLRTIQAVTQLLRCTNWHSGHCTVHMHRRCNAALLVYFAVQLKQVVAAVVQRAADLIAAGLVALLSKAGAPEKCGVFGVAVDGSVYHKYPKFRSRLHIALARALRPIGGVLDTTDAAAADMVTVFGGYHKTTAEKFRAKFVDVQNGSCFGAAVVAASSAVSGATDGVEHVENAVSGVDAGVGELTGVSEEGTMGAMLPEGDVPNACEEGLRQRRGGSVCTVDMQEGVVENEEGGGGGSGK